MNVVSAVMEALPLDSTTRRMQSFVAWHGQIPAAAKRVEEHEAQSHAAAWLRRHLGGRGIVHSHVIAYVLGEHWWTLFFQRVASEPADGIEQWCIEAYDDDGKSWSRTYYYIPDDQWRPAAFGAAS